jgi:hypothetical protein
LLVVAGAVEQVRAIPQIKVLLIGAVVVVVALDMTVDQVVAGVVPAVVAIVVLAVVAVVLPRPGAREAVGVRQVVAEVLSVAQTHALADPGALRGITSLAIRL